MDEQIAATEPHRVQVGDVYRRMLVALRAGRGMRLSADELEALYCEDDAVQTAIQNIERDDLGKAASR